MILTATNSLTNSSKIWQYIKGVKQGSETIETRPTQAITASREVLIGHLRDVAIKYDQNFKTMESVIQCESGFRTDVFSRGKISFGIAQFTKATFKENCSGDYKDPFIQLDCMGKMFSKHMENRWDCWRYLFGNKKPRFKP